MDKECDVKGCDRAYYASGLCRMHYARKWRGRAVGPAQPINRLGITPDRDEYAGELARCPCGKEFEQRSIGTPKLYCSAKCRARYTARERRATGYVRPTQSAC